jgi:large subunit ribosomal protein L29
MKIAELNGLSDEQLVHKALELERSLLGHTFRHRLGQLDDTSVLGKTRREIARAQTALTSRERSAGLNPGALVAKHRSTFVPAAPSAKDGGEGFLQGILDKPEAAE